MNIEDFKEFCLSLEGVEEKMPVIRVKSEEFNAAETECNRLQ